MGSLLVFPGLQPVPTLQRFRPEELAHGFPAGNLPFRPPDHRNPVVIPPGQPPAIAAYRQCLIANIGAVFQGQKFLAGPDVPNAHGIPGPPGDGHQTFTVRSESHG